MFTRKLIPKNLQMKVTNNVAFDEEMLAHALVLAANATDEGSSLVYAYNANGKCDQYKKTAIFKANEAGTLRELTYHAMQEGCILQYI